MHLEWSQNSRYGSRKYIYIISIDNLTTVNRLRDRVDQRVHARSALTVKVRVHSVSERHSASVEGRRPAVRNITASDPLNQKQPHCLINTESTFLNMRAQRPIWPEGESTLKHVGRNETALPFWLFGLYLVLYKAAFQSSTLDLQHRGERGKYITYNQWQTIVKHWLKHVKYGGRVYCHTLAFWKKFTFQKLGCSGPVERRKSAWHFQTDPHFKTLNNKDFFFFFCSGQLFKYLLDLATFSLAPVSN